MSQITLTDEEYKFLSQALHETDRNAIISRVETVVADSQSFHDSQSLHNYKTIRQLNWLSPQVNKHMAYRSLRDKFQDPYPPYVVELGVRFHEIRRISTDDV